MNKIVLDLETQKTFEEVGGRYMHLLKVSVVGIYHYPTEKYLTFEEKDILKLEEILKSVDLIIGFNIKRFDLPVLEPYLSFSTNKFHTLDIMQEIVKVTGHRVSLNSVAQATLGEVKSGTGLEAIELFREGRMKELKRYCLDDVRITKDLYEYGLRHGEILFSSRRGWRQYSIPASWRTGVEENIFDLLHQAYVNKQRVQIEYVSSTAQPGESFRKKRKVDIYTFAQPYFEAYCHLRKGLRSFKIDRVLSVKVLDETYKIPPDYTPGV